MITGLIDFVSNILVPFGFWGVFAGSLLEEIVAIIPSAIVSMGAGFVFLTGYVGMDFVGQLILYVILPVTLGIAIGSLPFYYLSYWLGEPFVKRWGKWFGLKPSDLEKLQALYQRTKFDEYVVLIARIMPFVPSIAVSVFSGLTRIPIRSYLFGTILGTPLRATFFGLAGWQFGSFYTKHAELFDLYDKFVLLIILLGIFAFLFVRRVLENRHKKML